MRFAITLAAVLAVSGCNSVTHQTASGRPEVTIRADNSQVKSALTGVLVNVGYTVTKDTDLQVVAEKTPNNVMAQVLFGSQYDGVPKARITYTLLPLGGSVRVIADMAIVTNPGSAFERQTPLSNHPDSAGVQRTMLDVKASLESGKPAGVAVADAMTAAQARKAAQEASKKGASTAAVPAASPAPRT